MYERYLSAPHIPAGAVLQHIMQRSRITQRDLAVQAGLPPQRVNDYIHGKRRISVDASFRLESALSIDHKGFFYTLQSNHDIYSASPTEPERTPDLSKIRKSIFWDTDLSRINWQVNSTSIIKRVFEYGDSATIDEIIHFYGVGKIKATLESIEDPRLESRRRKNAQRLGEYESLH